MGCIFSTEAVDDGALFPSGEVYVFVPGFRLPQPLDFIELLKGSVSAGLAAKLQALRSQVISAADRTEARLRKAQDDDRGWLDLEKALNDYLPVLLGLVSGGNVILDSIPFKDSGLLNDNSDRSDHRGDLDLYLGNIILTMLLKGEKCSSAIEYPWMNVEDERKDTALGSGYYELLSVLHLLGMLALQEANACLTPRPPADGHTPKATEGMCFALHPIFAFGRYISASLSWYQLSDEKKRNAIEILLKAASYFECALNFILPNTPVEIKAKLPADLTESMLKSLEQQALGQAVELQLWFAIDNVKASLAVKRRLACEHVEVWEQAMEKLACVPLAGALGDKHILFLKWKLAEAKAAAYYFHGVILDEGDEDNSHAESLSCLKAAHAHLKESQKARKEFGDTEPPTKVPPSWGPMKCLAERIPRETVGKGRIFKEHYSHEKFPSTTPKLPEFAIALEAEPFHLPPVDSAWNKEQGFEARPSLTPDIVPSFLATRKQLPMNSDLLRAAPMAPVSIVSELVVEA